LFFCLLRIAADLEDNLKPIVSSMPAFSPQKNRLPKFLSPLRFLPGLGGSLSGEAPEEIKNFSDETVDRFCQGLLAVEKERKKQLTVLQVCFFRLTQVNKKSKYNVI
jgi:hypothetical protein